MNTRPKKPVLGVSGFDAQKRRMMTELLSHRSHKVNSACLASEIKTRQGTKDNFGMVDEFLPGSLSSIVSPSKFMADMENRKQTFEVHISMLICSQT